MPSLQRMLFTPLVRRSVLSRFPSRRSASTAQETLKNASNLSQVLLKPRFSPISSLPPFTLSEVLGHTSFALVALSYSLDSNLALRCTAVLGSTTMLLFTFWHPHGRVLWLPFRWNALFTCINVVMIGRLLQESYSASLLSEVEVKTRDDFLPEMDIVDYCRLRKIAQDQEHRTGTVLFDQGEVNEYVYLVTRGEFECLVDGQKTYTITPGSFIAEAGLHAGGVVRGGVKTSGKIRALSDSSTMRFKRSELVDLIQGHKSLKDTLLLSLSWDIVSKLKSQRHRLSGGDVPVEYTRKWTSTRNAQTDGRYVALVSAMLGGESVVTEDNRRFINNYARIHSVADEKHEFALKQCGWTLEEFEDGKKRSIPQRRWTGAQTIAASFL